MGSRKQELTDQLIAYLVEHGPTDLALRPMAAATGTSARLLIFHFHSKEELLATVLEGLQARVKESLFRLLERPRPERTPLLRLFWQWALAPDNLGLLRLLYQLHMLATHAPEQARYLKQNTLNWLEWIQAALPPALRDPATATLFGAVFDGLFIEFLSSGDRDRTTAALERFIALARSSAPAPES